MLLHRGTKTLASDVSLPCPTLADPVTRAGAVRHALLTTELATRLAGDPDHQVRRQVAEHPQLPPPARDLLAKDSSANVRVGVFSRSDTPEPVRHRVYTEIQQGDRPSSACPPGRGLTYGKATACERCSPACFCSWQHRAQGPSQFGGWAVSRTA
ncbi:hypothetical protein [Micromonospora tarapacensis]|uniref:hypothetical protein n=1 Tax=Micromonospora tarapacensis TaxID=2835305 RepID=UPI001E295792|nr:hypothetical protein [Micromonospora tarapacensis]